MRNRNQPGMTGNIFYLILVVVAIAYLYVKYMPTYSETDEKLCSVTNGDWRCGNYAGSPNPVGATYCDDYFDCDTGEDCFIPQNKDTSFDGKKGFCYKKSLIMVCKDQCFCPDTPNYYEYWSEGVGCNRWR